MGEVDSRVTSQTCPNCRITVKKELKDRVHKCPECKYEIDKDVAAAQEIYNRGIKAVRPGSQSIAVRFRHRSIATLNRIDIILI